MEKLTAAMPHAMPHAMPCHFYFGIVEASSDLVHARKTNDQSNPFGKQHHIITNPGSIAVRTDVAGANES